MLGSKKMRPRKALPIVVLVYKRAFGEALSGFPLAYLLRQYGLISGIAIYYENRAIQDSVQRYDWHNNAVEKFDVSEYRADDLPRLVARIWASAGGAVMVSCDAGSTQREKFIGLLCPMLRFAYFHHAHSLFAEVFDDQEQRKQLGQLRQDVPFRYAPGATMVVWSEQNRAYYRALGFDDESIVAVGSCAYAYEWRNAKSKLSDQLVGEAPARAKQPVLIALRGPNRHYLDVDTYAELVRGLCEVVSTFPDQEFLLRPHPRQSVDADPALSTLLSMRNVSLTDLDILEATRGCRALISFWSSSIYDALAERKPAIEFYKHEKVHSQTRVSESSAIESMMHHLQVCPSVSDATDVVAWLRDILAESGSNDRDQVFAKLQSLFLIDGTLDNRLSQFMEQVDQRARRGRGWSVNGAKFAARNAWLKLSR